MVLRQEQAPAFGQFCSESIRIQEQRERMFSLICYICRERMIEHDPMPRWVGLSPRLDLIRRKVLPEIMKPVLVLVIFFWSAITWSQTQVTDQSDPLEYAQQSPTSQSNPAPGPPTDSSTVSLPDQAPAPQNKKDASQAQQSTRMFWLVPNFAAVNANTRLPPLSTREKFVLAA